MAEESQEPVFTTIDELKEKFFPSTRKDKSKEREERKTESFGAALAERSLNKFGSTVRLEAR